MKRSIKQLLSAVLVVAMIATLLVVPAAAANPGEIGYKWDFTTTDAAKKHSDPTATYSQWDAMESDQYEGLTLNSVSYHGTGYGINSSNGSIAVTVPGKCDIKVAVGYDWNLQMGDVDNAETHKVSANPGSNNGYDTLTFQYTGEAGTVALNAKGTSYIASIELAPSTADPGDEGDELATYTITADATATVKVGETVSVGVSADKGGEVYATTEDTSLITLGAIANGKLPITGKAKGTATVTLGVTDGKGSATIEVEVTEDATVPEGPRTEWWFRSGKDGTLVDETNGVTIQSTTGTLEGLEIDATNGKFSAKRGDWAQFNTGTVIKVPVDAPDGTGVLVSVMAYMTADPTLKVGETANEGAQAGVDMKIPATVQGGFVTITATANDYIGHIKVETLRTEWWFRSGKDGTLVDETNGVTIQGATGTLEGLEIDATNGKFSAKRGDWAQFNTGTVIKVPVAAPDGTGVLVSVMAYMTADPTLKVGETANEGATAGVDMGIIATVEGGFVTITATANDYIGHIKVDYAVPEGEHQFAKLGSGVMPSIAGLSFNGNWDGNASNHGPKSGDDGLTFDLLLGGDANVTIYTCQYSSGDTAVKLGDTEVTPTDTAEPMPGDDAAGKIWTFKKVPAGKATFTATKGNTYIHTISVEYVTEEVPEILGNGKVDVWDFGAAKLDEARFNNMLTVDVLKNSAWGDKKAGSFGDAELNGLTWFGGGSTNHRLYTTNADLSGDPMVYGEEGMSDELAADPYFKDVEGYDAATAYTGYVYSNNNAQGKTVAEGKVVYIGLDLKAGDKVSIIVSSNGGNSTITFEGPSGVEATSLYETNNRKKGEVKTFYAREDGAYKIYSADEKLVVARVYREHPVQLVLTGDVTVPEGKTLPAGLSLTFTNNKSGGVKEAEVKEGETAGTYTYRTVLEAPYDYTVAVKNSKGGFIVETGGTLELAVPAEGDVAEPHTVGLTQVPLLAISGTLTGPDAAYVAAHKPVITMTPSADYIYVPEVTVNGLNYSFDAQKGVEYTVGVTMVNDFSGPATEKVTYDADKADDTIVLTAKPTYDITLTTSPADVDLTNAKITFVNLFEAGKGDETQTIAPYDATQAGKGAYPYTYNFTGATGIKLRDGQYEVLVAGVGAPEQGTTANLKVNGGAATLEVPFNTEIPSVWDFADADFDETDLPAARGGDGNYKGLVLEGNIQKNKTYCLMGNAVKNEAGEVTLEAAKVKIPVKAAGNVVSIEFCYSGTGTLGGEPFAAYPSADGGCGGSTSQFQTVSYTATAADAEAGYVEINIADTKAETDANGPQIYLTKVTASTETYQPTLKVGADKDYKTINAALAAVDKMARTPEQRVTIEIDPGTYEEHVIVTANNVTLKNAKAADAKLELKNKGVDIGDNEVRITHYYGTGYDYYSMTPGTFQWSEDTLKASVANGYAATENKGDGKYNGYGYWCASVLVKGSGFEAEGIIFENSFNQYVSKKSTEDTIVPNGKLKEDKTNPRAEMKTVGDTTVQKKAYVERAAAVAITNTADQAYFNHCAIVGRQDALYGDPVRAAFYDCDIYGGTDYIFGPMTAVFAQCDLILNTSETDTDVAYIVAPQQDEGVRGYLMWNCTVTSTVPGVNTASALRSKPGQWGRPWSNTSEAVFYATNVESTLTTVESGAKTATEGYIPLSLIGGAGWLSGLSSGSARCVEFDTIEAYTNIDNSAKRDTEMSGGVLTEAKTADGVDITDYKTWMGDWNPLPDGLTVKRQTQGTYVETDKAALKTAITAVDAYKVADDVTVMPAGTKAEDVTKDQKFITQDVVDALAKALADAKTVLKDVNATQAQVDAAVKALNDAAAAFNAAVQTGTNETAVADKAALTAAIDAAKGVYAIGDDVKVEPAGTKASAVAKGQKFVTQDAVDALAKAIADAQAVLANANATQADVDAAVAALNAAVKTFQAAIQTGTKSAGGNGGGRPSSSSGSTTGTTTKTNANGDTVKKTTDSKGNVVYTVTDKNGEVIAKVEIPATRTSTKKFKDVPEGHWAEASINDLAALGMVNGVADEIYDMVSPVTRGSVATILFRLAQAKGVAADFSDVAEGAWYAEAVGWAAKYGVVNGFEDGTFKADESITREQLAVMLYRFANLLAVDTRATGDLAAFADADGVSTWAADAMTWAVGAGIIKGNDAKELNATDAATRAETACMVDRFIALLK